MSEMSLPHIYERLFALTLIPLTIAAGCNKASSVSLPATHTVAGQVVDKAGRPVTVGAVEFVSMQDEKVQAIGKMNADGTFSLTTAIGKDTAPGAVEGSHRVTFLPGTRGQTPHYFHEKYEVRPGENRFKLVYPYESAAK